ncbi:hypothetical protein WDU94_006518 [Cyamophila willieti]
MTASLVRSVVVSVTSHGELILTAKAITSRPKRRSCLPYVIARDKPRLSLISLRNRLPSAITLIAAPYSEQVPIFS